ncbi:cell division protein ZapA [Enterococcus sp. HY326]|uniref:cell division protein ZapA n=1 Tax=Enterococcus sp. HY326 TaxID=2971265 RepID=UPI002240B176|nr:cell division protein ZapA [Enterococcus sp. HY326]
MALEKNRYKAVIDGKTYTIIGSKNKQHMDLVNQLVNDQLKEIRQISPSVTKEEGAVLLAINAVSDQLTKQTRILHLEKEIAELKQRQIRMVELENRMKRMEALEQEARDVLKKQGRSDVEVHNHVEAQQILNENRKQQIKEKTQS